MGLGFPSVGDLVNKGIDMIAKAIWGFASSLLSGVFSLLSSFSKPTIIYTPDGPLGKVFPVCLWLGLLLVIGLSFAQTGLIAINGVRSVSFMLKGIGQYVLLSTTSLGILAGVSSFAGVCATGILSAAFNVDDWQGLSGDQTFMAQSIKGLSGVGLGFLSLLLVIPFALGLLTEILIREAAMEVLAATFPLISAGLVHEKFARWYWTGLRWMLALIFMLPLIALSMAIGHSIGLAAGHTNGNPGADVAQAAVSGIVSCLSLVWPFFLFKLFAFVDPNTVAGQSFRGSVDGMFGGSNSGGGEDTESESQEQEGTSDGGAGEITSAPKVPGAGGAGDSTSGGGDAMSSLQAGTEALRSFGGDQSVAAGNRASGSMDGVGAGHPGGGDPQGGGDDEDSDPQNHGDSDDSGTESDGPGSGDGQDSNDPTPPGGGGDDSGDGDITTQMPGQGQAPGGMGSGPQGGPGDQDDDPQPPGGGQNPPGGGGGAGGGEAAGGTEAAAVVV